MSKLRCIIYEKATGNRVYDCCYSPPYTTPTLEQLHAGLMEIKARDIHSLGLICYENGEFENDFQECGANFIIDLATLQPQFDYPDPNNPEAPQVFQRPLTEQIAEVKAQTQQLNEDFLALSDYVTNGGI